MPRRPHTRGAGAVLIFRPLAISGAFVIDITRQIDGRGSFARTFCSAELEAQGLDARVVQTSLSSNTRAGTLRGMHYAARPSREAKLVRCVRGRVVDALLDLRCHMPTFGKWTLEELSRDNGRALFVPPGVAHGFLTLEDDTDLLYQMTEPYDPALARGVRYNDRAFGIVWPERPLVVSERDRGYPDYVPDSPPELLTREERP
jgi:dTDP-4-dehydrorhamnose 3,5-epimerase